MKPTSRHRILCVDDEPEVLSGLAANLSRHYEVLTAPSGESALELLQRDPQVAVIISDMRMPGMNGATFLARSRVLAPQAQRILLTGHTDLTTAIAAVNEGEVLRFLSKPCPFPELARAVKEATDRYESHAREREALRRDIVERQLRVDPETGLPNRVQLIDTLEATARHRPDFARALVAYYIDLITSTDSYAAIDGAADEHLPRMFGQWLARSCPSATAVARWGPEQFVVIVPMATAGDLDLHLFGQHLLSGLKEVQQSGSGRASGSACIGFARLGAPARWAVLIQHAALAARQARRDGAEICLYRPEVKLPSERDFELLRALRDAIETNAFEIHCQPMLNLATGRIRGFECLARWHDVQLGTVAPATFIPLAEQSGEIVRLGRSILAQSCRVGAAFLATRGCKLSVNVSALEFLDPEFVPCLTHCLSSSGLAPQSLELELTESELARDIDRLRAVMGQLRNLKVRIAVDDFGTGYSSLSYLSHLPIDIIKVDQVFVRDFDQGGKTIIKAALDIARDFGREVIIEGIETEKMLQQVRALGASTIQGYWLARPMPAARVPSWLDEFESRLSAVPQAASVP
jgi:predicted signal transduction protein with EAL and GGDEF domain